MVVGLPGAGISSVFYLLCVLLMPLHALYRAAIGRPLPSAQWRFVLRHWVIAAGIILTLLAVAWLLGTVISAVAPASTAGVVGGSPAEDVGTTIARLGVYLTVGTLLIVLGVVQVASLILRRRAVTQPLTNLARYPRSPDQSRKPGYRPLRPLPRPSATATDGEAG